MSKVIEHGDREQIMTWEVMHGINPGESLIVGESPVYGRLVIYEPSGEVDTDEWTASGDLPGVPEAIEREAAELARANPGV